MTKKNEIAKREAALFHEIEQVVNFPKNSLSLVGLRLTDVDMPYEEWTGMGRSIGHVQRWSAWATGDWINFGEAVYGDMAAQAVEGTTGDRYDVASRITGLAPATLQNYASICGRIALSRRRVELPFSVHEPVAALPAEEQSEWLQKAIDNGWGRQELRDAIKADKTGDGGDDGEGGGAPGADDSLSVSEQIEAAARTVYGQASQNKTGDWVVPKPAMAQLAAALGEE